MKKTILCIICLVAIAATAQTYKETPDVKAKIDLKPDKIVLLYPKGQKGGVGIIENGVQITQAPQEDNELTGEETCSAKGSRRNVGDEARMDIYLPKKNATGQMVIMTPGGGYSHLSTFNEGVYGSKWLTDQGIAVCVVKYRMPNGHKTVPLDDAQNAFRYCRYHAKEWGVKQIGVMGGSAGGYLAASCSVYWTDSITRPDFAVLIYPRITFRRGEVCDTKENLLGKDDTFTDVDAHKKLLEEFSPNNYVNKQTPPTYIVLSADDNSVPATNMVEYYTQLIKNGVSTELHVYPSGGHGWGFTCDEIIGKGKTTDKFAKYRGEFFTSLKRWLSDVK